MKTAVLVIDVQRALSSGPFAAYEAGRVVDRINHVIDRARGVGAPVVIVQHEESEGPFAFGSDGWQSDAALHALPSDVHVRKATPDSFHKTDLHEKLRSMAIEQLVVCGFQSEYCIDSTTRRALALGYPVTLVSDGHSTLDNGVLEAAKITAHHTETLSNIDSFGIRVRALPADEVEFAG